MKAWSCHNDEWRDTGREIMQERDEILAEDMRDRHAEEYNEE